MRSQNTSYLDNSALIFQFVVTEYFAIHSTMNDLLMAINAKDLAEVFRQLFKLNGPLEGNVHTFSGNYEDGLLPKFCHSSFYFANVDDDNIQGQKLNRYAEQMHKITHRALKIGEDCDVLKPLRALQEIKKIFAKIQESLKKMGETITKIVGQFEDDEGMLFFLIRNYEKFDKAYHPNYILKLMAKMFPNGVLEAEKYMLKQYSERGFNQLLPEISKFIGMIQKQKSRS